MWSFCRRRRFYLKHPYQTVDTVFLPEPTKPLNPALLTRGTHAKISGLLGGYRGRELEARKTVAQRKPLYVYSAGHNYYGQCGLIGNAIHIEEINTPTPERQAELG